MNYRNGFLIIRTRTIFNLNSNTEFHYTSIKVLFLINICARIHVGYQKILFGYNTKHPEEQDMNIVNAKFLFFSSLGTEIALRRN